MTKNIYFASCRETNSDVLCPINICHKSCGFWGTNNENYYHTSSFPNVYVRLSTMIFWTDAKIAGLLFFVIINWIFLSHGFKDMPPVSGGFLLGLLFGPEDGGIIFVWNVGLSPNYMALNPIKTILFLANAAVTSNSVIKCSSIPG
jgi:hypothetical protein